MNHIIEEINTKNFKLWVFDKDLKKIFVVGKLVFLKKELVVISGSDTELHIRRPLLLRGTGRCDMNGNDIYDGCTVLSHSEQSNGVKGVIWFNPSTASFGIDWDGKSTMSLQHNAEFEVVGHSLLKNKGD